MHPITTRHLSDFEELLTDSLSAIGASDNLAVLFLGDTYYAVNRWNLERVLDGYHETEKLDRLRFYSYFVFRFITERTLLVLKSRIPLDILRTRLERHRYIVVDDLTTEY